MDRGFDFTRRAARYGLWFGGALILLAAIVIGIDVVLRKFLQISIGGANELAGYALAIGAAWAMPATLLDRAHIRIDSLYTHFSMTVRVWLDLLGLALFLGFFGLIAWHGAGVAEQSWAAASRSDSALQIPLVIPQTLWVVGLCCFIAVGLLLMAHAVRQALLGNRAEVVRLIGTRSTEEEVQDELREMQAEAEAVPP